MDYIVEYSGYTVVQAENKEKAIEAANEHLYDLEMIPYTEDEWEEKNKYETMGGDQMEFRVGDIVVRTTETPLPAEAFEGMNDKGKVGVIGRITDDGQYYELNDGYMYDETEIRLANMYEIRAALRNVMKHNASLVEGL